MENTVEKKPTLGERRVRVSFNPGNDDYVYETKEAAAKFIDLVDQSAASPKWDEEKFKEWARLKALAMTAIEEASMWAVKAATI